ncbi:MAG: amidohydrolase [Actinomycetota bacterium]|nr:amidohydrolase [Actinomycetota bacterium]
MSRESLVGLRRELHAHPELSEEERGTAARIEAFLSPLGPDRVLAGVGGHGLVATFDSGRPGPELLVRCELDALPIVELGDADHRSTNHGVSHQCGHDGHMAMVCGLAEHVARNRPAAGAVHLLFQPAEEIGAGAAAVLADPAFAAVRPDIGVAIHNLPGHPLGAVVVKEGTLNPAVRSIVFRFTGRTAHAMDPSEGENPALAIADLLRRAQAMIHDDVTSDDFALITTVHVRVGSVAYGVSAGDGEAHFTMRCWDNGRLAALQAELVALAEQLAARDRLALAWDTLEDFYSNHNDPAVTATVRAAAADAGLEVITPDAPPLRAGEDFGLFTTVFPCCMVLLGTGVEADPLHSPTFDFPDELIDVGVRLYEAIVARVFA